MKTVKYHCHVSLFYYVKINDKYEGLYLYILIHKKWYSINKPENKYKQILMIEKWD